MPNDIQTLVRNCASLAALLEVSAYPKPGNIHRLNDFPETSYEHFLAGGIAIGSIMGELAEHAHRSEDYSNIGIGAKILEAVKEMQNWQTGGNTHLGVILLFSPLSAGAGKWIKSESYGVNELREQTKRCIDEALPVDSLNIYEAINRAMPKKHLGSSESLDLTNEESSSKIIQEKIRPIDVFRLCKDKDMICHEWVTGFETVFKEGYSYLKNKIDEKVSINSAIVDTFLKLLSINPDSLIKRKRGLKEAKWVSERAGMILKMGGIASCEGNRLLWELDEELKMKKGDLNPGTTADITAASVYVLLLTGWRP